MYRSEVCGWRPCDGISCHNKFSQAVKTGLTLFGVYRVLKVHPNGLTMCPVDKPIDEPIHVNTDRVTRCPVKLPDTCWLGSKRSCKSCKKQ